MIFLLVQLVEQINRKSRRFLKEIGSTSHEEFSRKVKCATRRAKRDFFTLKWGLFQFGAYLHIAINGWSIAWMIPMAIIMWINAYNRTLV